MMKSFYILLFTTLICAASCRAPKGDPGPAGTAGTAGTDGTNGTDGESTLDKQGFIMGTLAYVDYKDSALSLPFNYEYTESLGKSEYETYTNQGTTDYYVYVSRKDITDNEKYFTLSFGSTVDKNGVYQAPTSGSINFSYITNINNKTLFQFYNRDGEGPREDVSFGEESSTATAEFTNYTLDTLSGRLTFSYKITYSADDINSDYRYDDTTPAVITGSVDVVLNRKRYPAAPIKVVTTIPENNL